MLLQLQLNAEKIKKKKKKKQLTVEQLCTEQPEIIKN